MILLGLTGLKQSGKNTVANIIARLVQPRIVHELAFAKHLKQEACEMLKITLLELETNKRKYRTFMQGLSDTRKFDDEQFYIKKLLLDMSTISGEGNPILVVTDVRFISEATIVQHLNGIVIAVTRPGLPASDKHRSETEMLGIKPDYLITNDSTLEALEEQVRKLLTTLKIIK